MEDMTIILDIVASLVLKKITKDAMIEGEEKSSLQS